jgi:mannose-1-phosphate guanylyltransferase/mannose-6-phosphate isomerase
MKTIPVILAGGSGSRLWPLSRQAYPKQFLPLVKDNETLLQSTVLRIANNELMHSPIIVCNEEHRFIVAEQLREIGVQPQAIILEPEAKNTAPAIALAAYYAKKQMGDVNLCIMPADHIIHDAAALLNALQTANTAITAGSLVAFGIRAQYPDTAYGYIKVAADASQGVYKIDRFVEKPDLVTAKEYIDSGQYYWNCGIFAFRADAYLQQLQNFAPTMAQLCQSAIEQMRDDSYFIRPNRQIFSSCRSDSIDYAVMEKTDKSAMVLLSTQWNDVGSWDALMREHKPDEQGNVKIGDVVTQQVSDSYLRAENKLLAVAGVTDHVIVVTEDAVLVAHKDHCQNIKHLVNDLKSKQRSETEFHVKVHRPWGSYQTIAEGPHFKVKKIVVNPQQSLSLQRHQRRSEHWVVILGEATIVNGDRNFTLRINESTFIPATTQHRLANTSDQILELIEVQVGDYLGEDDIERLADIYDRAVL